MRQRIVSFLAVLAAILGMGALSASPAVADYGDWWTQYSVTYNHAKTQCDNHWRPYGYTCAQLGAPAYDGSGPYGSHSRYFVWHWPTAGGRACYETYYIGHSYNIFAWYHDCR